MDNRIGLTPRQQEVLAFIVQYYREEGYYPFLKEICEGKINGEQVIKKVSSRGTITLVLECLERKGYLKREKGSPRALCVL